MCEHRQIDPTERIIYHSSPIDAKPQRSYLSTIKIRTNTWTRLISNLNKQQFHDIFYKQDLTDNQKQRLWLLLAYCNYHLLNPSTFFDFLGEAAIEEKVTLKSFSTADVLRSWGKNSVPSHIQDNILVFLYLVIRDGGRVLSLIDTIDSL